MTIEQFIAQCDMAHTESELFNLLAKELAGHGIDYVIFSLLTNHHDLQQTAQRGRLSNVDNGWVQELNQGRYDDLDPFRSHCFFGLGALTLAELKTSEHLSASQSKFIQATEAAGLHDRITVALRGGSGSVASLDLARATKLPNFTKATIHQINAVCQHFYIAYCQLQRKGPSYPYLVLTGKEREVLEWSAKGFTKAEIGLRLHISSHTVDYHSRKLARKLGARNITAAAVNALNRGLINVN